MHGGKCQDFGSGLNCTCSNDYTGIGCQYEFDACEAGLCQNGATCVDDGENYSCICAPGFKGKNCDEDIIDCKENSCPPSATCIDLPGRFYCQCPFNLTGDDCRKSKFLYSTFDSIRIQCFFLFMIALTFDLLFTAISVDFDLYFSDPLRSSAAQVVPFDTGSTDSLTLAMWVQYTQQDEGGIFFTAYSVRYASIFFC